MSFPSFHYVEGVPSNFLSGGIYVDYKNEALIIVDPDNSNNKTVFQNSRVLDFYHSGMGGSPYEASCYLYKSPKFAHLTVPVSYDGGKDSWEHRTYTVDNLKNGSETQLNDEGLSVRVTQSATGLHIYVYNVKELTSYKDQIAGQIEAVIYF